MGHLVGRARKDADWEIIFESWQIDANEPDGDIHRTLQTIALHPSKGQGFVLGKNGANGLEVKAYAVFKYCDGNKHAKV